MNQHQRSCGTHNDSKQKQKKLYQKFLNKKVKDDQREIIIPIIFHICYPNPDNETIQSDAKYTIKMLNKDFAMRGSNFDIGKDVYKDEKYRAIYQDYLQRAAQSNIRFVLNDIVYKDIGSQDSENLFILDEKIKGASPAINAEHVLNFWIADITSNILGYAQFPWDLEQNALTDGVVITKRTFGRNTESNTFDLNKTATHEVGHWLGLYHNFQRTLDNGHAVLDNNNNGQIDPEEFKGDCIEDTPPQGEPSYNNPFKQDSWPKSKAEDQDKSHYHMFMNFMDYSDDIALFMFTQDQVMKMRQMIHIYRPELLDSPIEPVDPETDEDVDDSDWSEGCSCKPEFIRSIFKKLKNWLTKN